MVNITNIWGGKCRLKLPLSLFNVPFSCLPTPKPPPRKQKSEFFQQSYFDNTDRFELFADFQPEKALLKKYPKVLIFRLKQKITIIFINESETESEIVITVQDKRTLYHQPLLWCLRRESEFSFHETS